MTDLISLACYKEYKNIQTVHVATATPLSDENRAAVMAFLKTRTNEEIILVEDIKELGDIAVKIAKKIPKLAQLF